jgi:hypothetical protein
LKEDIVFVLYFLSQILHFTHIFERNKTSWKSGFSPIYKHLVHFSWFKKKSTTRIVVWSHYLNLLFRTQRNISYGFSNREPEWVIYRIILRLRSTLNFQSSKNRLLIWTSGHEWFFGGPHSTLYLIGPNSIQDGCHK